MPCVFSFTLQECQFQFKNRRWNCSTTDNVTVFGPMTAFGEYLHIVKKLLYLSKEQQFRFHVVRIFLVHGPLHFRFKTKDFKKILFFMFVNSLIGGTIKTRSYPSNEINRIVFNNYRHPNVF